MIEWSSRLPSFNDNKNIGWQLSLKRELPPNYLFLEDDIGSLPFYDGDEIPLEILCIGENTMTLSTSIIAMSGLAMEPISGLDH